MKDEAKNGSMVDQLIGTWVWTVPEESTFEKFVLTPLGDAIKNAFFINATHIKKMTADFRGDGSCTVHYQGVDRWLFFGGEDNLLATGRWKLEGSSLVLELTGRKQKGGITLWKVLPEGNDIFYVVEGDGMAAHQKFRRVA